MGKPTLVPNTVGNINRPPKANNKGEGNITISKRENTHPLLQNRTLTLAAWLVSGIPSEQRAYQRQLQSLSQTPEQSELEAITAQPGKSLKAGVINKKWIPFLVL